MRKKQRKTPRGETKRKAERKLHQLRRQAVQGFADRVFDAAQKKVPVGDGGLRDSAIRPILEYAFKPRVGNYVTGFKIEYTAPHAKKVHDRQSGLQIQSGSYIQDTPAVRRHDRTYTGKGGRRRQTIQVNYPEGRNFGAGREVVYWKGKRNTTDRTDGSNQFYTRPIQQRGTATEGWLQDAYTEVYKQLSMKTKMFLGLPRTLTITD